MEAAAIVRSPGSGVRGRGTGVLLALLMASGLIEPELDAAEPAPPGPATHAATTPMATPADPTWRAIEAQVQTQVDRAVAAIAEEDRLDPELRARALSAIDPGTCTGAAVVLLPLVQGEAWLDARDLDAVDRASGTARDRLLSITPSAPGAAAVPLSPSERIHLAERLGRLRLARWEAARRTGHPMGDPVALLTDLSAIDTASGAWLVQLRAQALALRSKIHLAARSGDALADLDAAIALVNEGDPAIRRPLYALRITTMEALGADPEHVRVWLARAAADPATTGLLPPRGSTTAAPLPPTPRPAADEPP